MTLKSNIPVQQNSLKKNTTTEHAKKELSGAGSQHRKLLMHLYCPDPYMICLRCKYCGSFETQVEMGWTETNTK